MNVEQLRLKRNHSWKSKPGYSICVLDRGAVRFDYPSNWIVEPAEGAVILHDSADSVERCDLGVSIFRVPPEELADLPMEEILLNSLGAEREAYQQSEIYGIQRPDLDIAWVEQRYLEQEYQRDARFRVALARGAGVCLISLNYWSSGAALLEPVWDEVLRTLVMGMYVEDPTMGYVVN